MMNNPYQQQGGFPASMVMPQETVAAQPMQGGGDPIQMLAGLTLGQVLTTMQKLMSQGGNINVITSGIGPLAEAAAKLHAISNPPQQETQMSPEQQMQLEMLKMQHEQKLDMQKMQFDMQLEQQKAQHKMQLDAMQAQLKAAQAQQQMQQQGENHEQALQQNQDNHQMNIAQTIQNSQQQKEQHDQQLSINEQQAKDQANQGSGE